ncbi:DUF2096 family protein [Bacteroidota bacterium]
MTTAERQASYDLLKKYGARWAVLAAIEVDLMKKRVNIPHEISKSLEAAHVKISSGCFSTCEADCSLSKVESNLIPLCSVYGDEYVDYWYELLGRAMQGQITREDISDIPLLKPVETNCGFLECVC